MIDKSLQARSLELDEAIKSQIAKVDEELDKLYADIEELNKRLSDKEMTSDRSENADFQIASDNRMMKVSRVNFLSRKKDSMLSELSSYVPTGFISLGSTVALSIVDNGDKRRFLRTNFVIKLVQHDTSNSTLGLVAIDSPVGSALDGRTDGETVTVEAPGGNITYKIERIY